jgi:hypothetical protein
VLPADRCGSPEVDRCPAGWLGGGPFREAGEVTDGMRPLCQADSKHLPNSYETPPTLDSRGRRFADRAFDLSAAVDDRKRRGGWERNASREAEGEGGREPERPSAAGGE